MTLNPFKPFGPYLRPYRRAVATGILLLLGAQAISTALPMALKWAIDTAASALENGPQTVVTHTGSVRGDIALYAGAMAGLALLQWCLSFGMRWYLSGTSRYVERDLRAAYVRHILALPLGFFQQRRVGDLMARATNDVEAIQRFLHHAFRMTLTGLLTFFLSLTLMCVIDWQLALICLLPMPVMAATTNFVSSRIRSGFRRVQEQFAEMSACIQENLSGMRVVKGFGCEQLEIERFAELNHSYVERNRRLVRIRSVFFPFAFLLNGISIVVVLWLGGMRVIEEGSLTLGSFVAFNAYLIQMGRPMMMLGRMVDEFQRAVASLARIEAVLQEPPEARGGDGDSRLKGEIELRHLSFAYDGHTVLDDVSLRVPPGNTLAVIGVVGSGKSTIARLIPRLIQAGAGQILIDGVPVEEIPLHTLRRSIGYVPQDTFLFSDTIRANVALGDEAAADDDVKWAVDVAQLSADLGDLPDGLDTVVGERGVTLSGGQKQRAAIARGVIGSPPILIFDDALASVDTGTESEILRRLEAVIESSTTILIAHRISTVRKADRIIVLEAGHIAEQGTHDELVALDGIYAELCRRQDLAQELSEL